MLSQNTLINADALDSQVYNPTIDTSVLQLYQVMASNSAVDENNPSDPIMADYHASITSLPTDGATRYSGILTNPASCFITEIRDGLGDIPGMVTPITTGYPSTVDDWNAYLPTLNSDITGVNTDLDTLQDHTDRLTTNLPSLTGIAQGAMALATVLNALSNPCLGLDGFFGSIMDSGKQILQDITSQIASLKNTITDAISDFTNGIQTAIGPLISQIQDQMSIIKGKVTDAINKAKAEVANFAKALLAQARQGLADLLANLPKDPCLQSLLGSVATGAAAGIIG